MRPFISAAFLCLGLTNGGSCLAEGASWSLRTEAVFGGGTSSLLAKSTDNEFKWFTDSTRLSSRRNVVVTGRVKEDLILKIENHFYDSTFYGHLFTRTCLSLACFYGSTSVINDSEPKSIVTLSLQTDTLSIGRTFGENSDIFLFVGINQHSLEMRARDADQKVGLTQTIYSPYVGLSIELDELPFTDIRLPDHKRIILQGDVGHIKNSRGHILLRSISAEGRLSLNSLTNISIGIRSRHHSLSYSSRDTISRFSETVATPFVALTLLF